MYPLQIKYAQRHLLTKLRINELVGNNSWRPGIAKFTIENETVNKWKKGTGKISDELVSNRANNMLKRLLNK